MVERLFDMSNDTNPSNVISIMDIDFINSTKEELLEKHLIPRLKREEKCYLVTANPEIVMRTNEDPAYKAMVHTADFVVPDGAGIVMASKYLKQPIIERVPGYDLMVSLLDYADEQGLSCYFLGAKKQVNQKLIVEVKKKYPNLNIAGHHHGYFSTGDHAIVDDVVAAEPDMVFVALGSPRQDAWITTYIDKFTKGLFMGVGGSFDVLAGEVKRDRKSVV